MGPAMLHISVSSTGRNIQQTSRGSHEMNNREQAAANARDRADLEATMTNPELSRFVDNAYRRSVELIADGFESDDFMKWHANRQMQRDLRGNSAHPIGRKGILRERREAEIAAQTGVDKVPRRALLAW